jgi:5-methylcytosine-specific restriction endonuclease McrA
MANNQSWKQRTGLYWKQYIALRATILFEQDFGCGECGKLVGQIQGDAHLHHINKDPKDNHRTNLIVVCPDCHKETHANNGGLEYHA